MATPNYTIDPAKQTVSGQLTGLLQQDNPYIKQAKTQGEQYANKRGLLNSSIGAQASQDAAIQSALPIAQADAQIHNQFEGQRYGADLQENLNEQQNEFASSQNQAKFDQDWRMTLAESATQREIAALEQQSLQFAQFTKGVADINSADMTGSEKSAAVSSLWTQFQKGSAIADSLRNIEINSDGSVDRSGSTSTSTASYQASEPSPTKVSYTFGDGGFYVPGITTDGSGNVVDKNGQAAPEDKAPSYYTEGYTWELSGGAWVKKTIPKNTNIFDSYSFGQ